MISAKLGYTVTRPRLLLSISEIRFQTRGMLHRPIPLLYLFFFFFFQSMRYVFVNRLPGHFLYINLFIDTIQYYCPVKVTVKHTTVIQHFNAPIANTDQQKLTIAYQQPTRTSQQKAIVCR